MKKYGFQSRRGLASFNYITATGLSNALNGQVSHDKITRFLSEEELGSKQLWLLTKPIIRQHEQDDAVLIFDIKNLFQRISIDLSGYHSIYWFYTI